MGAILLLGSHVHPMSIRNPCICQSTVQGHEHSSWSWQASDFLYNMQSAGTGSNTAVLPGLKLAIPFFFVVLT